MCEVHSTLFPVMCVQSYSFLFCTGWKLMKNNNSNNRARNPRPTSCPHLRGLLPTPVTSPACVCWLDFSRPSFSNSIDRYSWLVPCCTFHVKRPGTTGWDFQSSATRLAENRNPFLYGAGYQFWIFSHVSNCHIFLFFFIGIVKQSWKDCICPDGQILCIGISNLKF